MSKDITIDSVYILSDQSIEEYFDWEIDANSRMLRYKILVQDGRVRAILYNTG